jgi:hypothetical protein
MARGGKSQQGININKSFLVLSCYHHDHLARQCNMQNQVHLKGVNNDNIGQLANAVN